MQLKFFNTPEPEQFELQVLPKNAPPFIFYTPLWHELEKLASEYAQYKNVLIVGHGGSVTSFLGLCSALAEKITKQVYFLSTVDPDYISWLRSNLHTDDTIVIAISKSGETVTQLEALMHFLDYPLLCITESGSPLSKIAAQKNARVFPHPPIGGRYTGLTEVALVPAAICGLNVHELYAGASKVYEQYESGNLAWRAASVLWQLEQKGYVDVFVPIYSHFLFPMEMLIVQLCHESFGKNGKGQSYLAFEAPESQHHTNQRFFGGKKNIAGFFLGVDHPTMDIPTIIPSELHTVHLKEAFLGDLNRISLSSSLQSELEGTLEDAVAQKIPVLHLSILDRSEKSIGELIAFWQLFAVYSSVLRAVNPFDQPQVESSKILGFQKRLEHKET